MMTKKTMHRNVTAFITSCLGPLARPHAITHTGTQQIQLFQSWYAMWMQASAILMQASYPSTRFGGVVPALVVLQHPLKQCALGVCSRRVL